MQYKWEKLAPPPAHTHTHPAVHAINPYVSLTTNVASVLRTRLLVAVFHRGNPGSTPYQYMRWTNWHYGKFFLPAQRVSPVSSIPLIHIFTFHSPPTTLESLYHLTALLYSTLCLSSLRLALHFDHLHVANWQ